MSSITSRKRSRNANCSNSRRLRVESLEDRRLMAGVEIDVTIFEDRIDPNDGETSLREAVIQANANPGRDTIKLEAGSYQLTRTGAGPEGGDLDITDDVTIEGKHQVTNNGNPVTQIGMTGSIDRVFEIESGADTLLWDLWLAGGSATDGGVIHNEGNLDIWGSRLSGGQAARNGGSIYNHGDLEMHGTILDMGRAGYDGGGLYNAPGADARLVNSQISQGSAGAMPNGSINYSGDGGGVYNARWATLKLQDSIVGYASSNSYGFGNFAFGKGGGLYNDLWGTVTVTDSTIAHNYSWGSGGGIYNANWSSYGGVTLENPSVYGNGPDNIAGYAVTSYWVLPPWYYYWGSSYYSSSASMYQGSFS